MDGVLQYQPYDYTLENKVSLSALLQVRIDCFYEGCLAGFGTAEKTEITTHPQSQGGET